MSFGSLTAYVLAYVASKTFLVKSERRSIYSWYCCYMHRERDSCGKMIYDLVTSIDSLRLENSRDGWSLTYVR
jgi:hypothetical protein